MRCNAMPRLETRANNYSDSFRYYAAQYALFRVLRNSRNLQQFLRRLFRVRRYLLRQYFLIISF